MKTEEQVSGERAEAQFKDLVFANDPQLYKVLFGNTVADEDIEAEEFDWVVPQNEEEARSLLAEMQGAMG